MTEAKEKARDDEKMTPEMRKAWGEAYCEFEQRLPSQKLMPHKSGFIAGYSAAAGQWVKIEDGLPDSDDWYLWRSAAGTIYKLRYAIEVDGTGWLVSSEPRLSDLIAWMPLPEPFTE